MADSLNVIALISGGKDSLFSLLHCIHNGHKIIALANLHPAKINITGSNGQGAEANTAGESPDEDIDSFMYQTVGYSVIPLYSKALGIPLYRRAITGSAVKTDRDYSYTTTHHDGFDETEDLIPLLTLVMQAHPDANAISTGAIQSTYQRTRVESVALRLGLTPLAYLWQYPVLPPPIYREESRTGLLEDMAAAGCDARIIKIASGGISDRWLWKNVVSENTMQGLVKGLLPFFLEDEAGLRGAVVGEGGEFETLALSGPRRVWKNGTIAVDVDNDCAISHEGGTSYARLGSARIDKHDDTDTIQRDDQSTDLVPTPQALDIRFEEVRKLLLSRPANLQYHDVLRSAPASETLTAPLSNAAQYKLSYLNNSTVLQISNINHKSLSSNPQSQEMTTPVAQMAAIATHVPKILDLISSTIGLSPPITTDSIVHATLLLRSMDTFTSINPVYASMFQQGIPNPPARVTIAAPLPDGHYVSLSVMIDLRTRKAWKGLHVQSRSYWAPANIGPYSQAISTPLSNHPSENQDADNLSIPHTPLELCYMAGQIPLVPATMVLSCAGFLGEALLSLQNLWRVGQECKVDFWAFGIAYLNGQLDPKVSSLKTTSEVVDHAIVAADVWKELHRVVDDTSETHHDNEDEIDVWNIRFNRSLPSQLLTPPASTDVHLHQLPLRSSTNTFVPPFIVPEMCGLPRNASIEWWSMGIIGLTTTLSIAGKTLLDLEIEETETYVCSELNITSRVKFIVYMIKTNAKPKSATQSFGYPYTTAKQLLTRRDFSVPTDYDLVSSLVFVAANAKSNWNSFCSNNASTCSPSSSQSWSSQISQSMAPIKRADVNDFLGDTASIVPCHRLFGHGGQSNLDMDEGNDPLLEELDLAFLLRFDAK